MLIEDKGKPKSLVMLVSDHEKHCWTEATKALKVGLVIGCILGYWFAFILVRLGILK